MPNFDDIISGFWGKVSPYSEEEIEEAEKKAKKEGGTVLDHLAEMTGKTLTMNTDAKNRGVNSSFSGSLDTAELERQLDEINKKLYSDFGVISEENVKNAEKAGIKNPGETLDRMVRESREMAEKMDASVNALEKTVTPVTSESFDGVKEKVSEKVFGQDAFLKKLLISFKRPYVLKEEEGHAKNTMLLTGPEDTGKHLALTEMVKELAEKKILSGPVISVMDLSIYQAAGQDNIFLQDLYSALNKKGDVILFEHYEECHVSYLKYVSDLVKTGKCQLNDRYMLQKGSLVNVTNSFASETVSTFSVEGKYLVFISTKGADKMADVMGAPFVNALGDIVKSEKHSDENYKRISTVRFVEVKEKAKNELKFILTGEEEKIVLLGAKAADKNVGFPGIKEFYDKLLKALAELRLENDYKENEEVTLFIEENVLKAKVCDEIMDLLSNLPESFEGAILEVQKELNDIVGLDEIKKYILSLEEYYLIQKRRKEAGLVSKDVSKHMIFTGNPGTGKTTIARIVGRYLKAIGVLTGGQLVEVTRADLVGRFVGHTAPLVNQVIQSALGGVLFIDEAYSLYRGNDDAFGLEAIDTLVKGIEDHRDNLIVILAGYSHEMEIFLESNSGLKSRFPNFINFPDYTGEELMKISDITAKKNGYKIDDSVRENLLQFYNYMQSFHADTAGNGRLVRNKIEEAILNQSGRLVKNPDADLETLLLEDFDLTIEDENEDMVSSFFEEMMSQKMDDTEDEIGNTNPLEHVEKKDEPGESESEGLSE